jgi:hypothetical protein
MMKAGTSTGNTGMVTFYSLKKQRENLTAGRLQGGEEIEQVIRMIPNTHEATMTVIRDPIEHAFSHL